jgi:DNA-binding response OmpR family regulator
MTNLGGEEKVLDSAILLSPSKNNGGEGSASEPRRSNRLLRPDGTPIRIVLVDDNSLQRVDMETTLTDDGGVILGLTAWGNTALILARQQRPDVVILDIGLYGDMDGIEVARRILADTDIAVVLVSGRADERIRAQVASLDGPQLLYKPVRPEELIAAVRRACGLE